MKIRTKKPTIVTDFLLRKSRAENVIYGISRYFIATEVTQTVLYLHIQSVTVCCPGTELPTSN